MAYLSLTLLVLAALFSGATVLAIIIALRAAKEQRNTIFPIVRESAGIKAKRALVTAALFLLLAAITIGGWTATQQNPDNVLQAHEATQQALAQEIDTSAAEVASASEDQPTQETQPVATETPAPAQITGSTVILTPEPTATASPTPQPAAPTVAPTDTPLPPTSTSNPSPIPAPPGSSIGPISFALDITDRREAVNPTTSFSNTTDKIYAVFPYSGMKNGTLFSAVWSYQGREIMRDEFNWEWGITDRSYIFIRPVGAGTYKVEFFVGTELKADGEFEVIP